MVATDNGIYISDKAKEKVIHLMQEAGVENEPNYFLRVGVVGGGCSGLSYKLDFDNDNIFFRCIIRLRRTGHW